MNEVLDEVLTWLAAGHKVVTATLVRVRKSAPRAPGALMAVNSAGEVSGSVSGGCVESALYEEAQEVMKTGRPRYLTYGIGDDEAFSVGLTCGGTIEVFLERLDWFDALGPALMDGLGQQRPLVTAVVVGGPSMGARLLVEGDQVLGSTGSAGLDAAVVAEARAMLRLGQTGLRSFGPDGQRRRDEVTCFIQSFAPPPRMLVFGAIDFAAAAVRMGKFLGYQVTLCDARAVFATRARFPEADEVVVEWPHTYLEQTRVGPRDALLVLTHDSKFDVPVLLQALRTEAGFIGVLGSRTTHALRRRELLEAGVSEADLERISSPVGLDIGGRTPEETAISIAAELIALKNGRPGGRLGHAAGRIHNDEVEVGGVR